MKSTRLIIPALSLAATTLLVAQGQPEPFPTPAPPTTPVPPAPGIPAVPAPIPPVPLPRSPRRRPPYLFLPHRWSQPYQHLQRFRLWPPRLLQPPQHLPPARPPFSRSPILPLGLVW